MRLDTVSLRGLFNQQIHGSKRSLRSVEDFTEFEQRTAYFNGEPIHALKKGMNILDRIQVTHMAQMQNMFDFPPAPKLTPLGRLDPKKATESELRGEKLFFGKAQCAVCHHRAAVLPRQPDARPAPGTLPQERGGRWPDQELYAPRHQGQPTIPARRPLSDPGGHSRSSSTSFWELKLTKEAEETGPGGVHATTVRAVGEPVRLPARCQPERSSRSRRVDSMSDIVAGIRIPDR